MIQTHGCGSEHGKPNDPWVILHCRPHQKFSQWIGKGKQSCVAICLRGAVLPDNLNFFPKHNYNPLRLNIKWTVIQSIEISTFIITIHCKIMVQVIMILCGVQRSGQMDKLKVEDWQWQSCSQQPPRQTQVYHVHVTMVTWQPVLVLAVAKTAMCSIKDSFDILTTHFILILCFLPRM